MPKSQSKPLLISGVQPTGRLTIANYIGAIRNWLALRDRYECYLFLADLHAISVRREIKELASRCYEFAAMYLACGVDGEKDVIFVQSHVPGHTDLMWILNSFSYMGELGRMTQFKKKAKSGKKDSVAASLFGYPVLMAADILLYGAELVPVGDDQKQHLELTRHIATRFNDVFGKVFKIPEPFFPQIGKRIRSLRDPAEKMSKSDENPKGYIALTDPPEAIKEKIRNAVTDSGKKIRCRKDKPGLCNLIEIYSAITNSKVENIENTYEGKGYAVLKDDLTDALISFLSPIQSRFKEFLSDRGEIDKILRSGKNKAKKRAESTMEKVRNSMELVPP